MLIVEDLYDVREYHRGTSSRWHFSLCCMMHDASHGGHSMKSPLSWCFYYFDDARPLPCGAKNENGQVVDIVFHRGNGINYNFAFISHRKERNEYKKLMSFTLIHVLSCSISIVTEGVPQSWVTQCNYLKSFDVLLNEQLTRGWVSCDCW